MDLRCGQRGRRAADQQLEPELESLLVVARHQFVDHRGDVWKLLRRQRGEGLADLVEVLAHLVFVDAGRAYAPRDHPPFERVGVDIEEQPLHRPPAHRFRHPSGPQQREGSLGQPQRVRPIRHAVATALVITSSLAAATALSRSSRPTTGNNSSKRSGVYWLDNRSAPAGSWPTCLNGCGHNHGLLETA